jgi:hypothetical protein
VTKRKANPERKLRLVKLVCGDTVLAGVLWQGDKVELTKPLAVMLIPDPSGQTLITLMDFIPASVAEKVSIHKDHVLCTAEANPKVLDLYLQATQPEKVVLHPPEKKLLLPGAKAS